MNCEICEIVESRFEVEMLTKMKIRVCGECFRKIKNNAKRVEGVIIEEIKELLKKLSKDQKEVIREELRNAM